MKKTIKFLVESKAGHDTFEVTADKVQEKVEEQLELDRNVTLEKADGETEILTKNDMPNRADKIKTEEEIRAEEKEWADNFKNTKTATSTKKTKGF